MIRLSDNHTIGLAAVNPSGPRLQIDLSGATEIAPGPKGGPKMTRTKMKRTKVKCSRDRAGPAALEASGAAGAQHISNGIVRIGVRR